MSSKEFEAIVNLLRKGEIVLWAGSGLSIYAGYPKAEDIVKAIMLKVPKEQKRFFKDQSLKEITEEYEKLFGRKKLNEILIELFEIEPKSLLHHEKLPLIPQLKTIVTTNYDILFERVYRESLKVIVTNDDLVTSNPKQKIELLKIHGTIEQPESIKITTSDYQAFFNEELAKNPLWTEIKSICTRNAILFIGYSLQDSDVKYIIYQILHQLKDSHKEIFLIAPNIPEHTIRDLYNQYHVIYLDKTGEELISDLINELDLHLVEDLMSGYISVDEYQTSLKLRGINSTITKGPQDNIVLEASKIDSKGPTEIKYQIDDRDLHERFQEFIAGESDVSFEMDSQVTRQGVQLSIKDIGFQFPGPFDSGHFTITLRPWKEYKTTIRLKNTDIIISDLSTKIYLMGEFLISKIYHPQFELTIKLHQKHREKSKFSFNYQWDCSPIRSYPLLKMLYLWVTGHDIIILNQETGEQFNFPVASVDLPKTEISRIKSGFKFFSDVMKIQDNFGINLQKVVNITEEDFKSIDFLLRVINGENAFAENITSTLKSYDTALLSKILIKESSLVEINGNRDILLFNQIIPVKYKIIINDAYTENPKFILEQMQNGIEEIKIVIKSRSGKIPIIFEK